jgi:hypothetical protein
MQRLGSRPFAQPDHEVIYRALAFMPEMDRQELRERLAQTVTRMGFPDMDLEALFREAPPNPNDLPSLLQLL